MEQQQQPQINTTPYQSPLDNLQSTILLLTDVDDSIKSLELYYRGMTEGKNGELKQITDPIMNIKGIHSVMGQVRTFISRITTMSSLDRKKEIPRVMRGFYTPLIKDIMLNRRRYKIENTSADRDKILWNSATNVYICAKRADEMSMSDKKFIKGSQQEIKTEVVNPRQKFNLFGFKGN